MLKVLEGHTSTVFAVAISVDGGKIVSGSGDNTVRVWSMETAEVIACCEFKRNMTFASISKTSLFSHSFSCPSASISVFH